MILNEMISSFEKEYHFKHEYIVGNDRIEIEGLNLCNRISNKKSVLSYAVSNKYVDVVEKAQHLTALIINKKDKEDYKNILSERNGAIIVVDNPEQYFYKLHEFLYSFTDFYNKFDFHSIIGENCNISSSAVIERGVIIGKNVTIGHNSVIKHGTVIEDNVIIGCNTTVGSEGFQLITDFELPPIHVIHAGGCHISNNVYIGDNVCICNSLFEGTTFIGENVKIDNLVYIGHNLVIKKNAVITAHVIICGSAKIEEGAWIAPNTSILNRVVVGKFSKVGMGSVVTKDVPDYATVYGNPARKHIK